MSLRRHLVWIGFATGLIAAVKSGRLWAAPGAPNERHAVIFYTAATNGVLEPCGCTSDPLGDIARVSEVVRRAQAKTGAALIVDAGNTLFPAGDIPVNKRQAAALRAAFLAAALVKLPFGGASLGEADLALGTDKVAPKRLAANLPPTPFTEPSRLTTVGGIRIGVMGIVDPVAMQRFGLKAEQPAMAAQREAQRLRNEGAEIVIALAAMDRALARTIARTAAIDFIVVGQNVGDGMRRADKVGKAFLMAPATELQRVGRIDLVLRGQSTKTLQGALTDAGGENAAKDRLREIDIALRDLDADLKRWAKDPSAEASFVAGKVKERSDLLAERARLASRPWRPPAAGSYFTNQLIPMRRTLPRDPTLQAALRSLDVAVGKANLSTAVPPPRAEPGRAAYVGDKACSKCHKLETAFWRTTVHARAWKTLVDVDKAADYECVSCHSTGYGEVGGSSLGYTKNLEDVQCETCHGPASLHVAAAGLDEPLTVHAGTPESTCARCHTEKHSDTFNYKAYLRDILGKGHGGLARDKLGAGPTGHELQSAALARAKAAGLSAASAAE